MKDISSKTDNTSSLPAASFNSMVSEMETVVTDAGFTLDNGSETTADPNPTQISAAIWTAARDSDAFTDSGSANAYVLTKIRGKSETTYRNGARFRFVPTNTNTGASTVNIQSLGNKDIRFPNNSVLTAGAIQSGVACEIYYNLSTDTFRLLLDPTATGTTPGLYVAGGAPGYTGDAASVSAGNLGAFTGTQRAETGVAKTFSTRSTTAITATAQSVNSITLNKGTYLVGGMVQCSHADGVSRRLNGYFFFGTTQPLLNLCVDHPTGALQTLQLGMIPINILADSIVLHMYAFISSLSGATSLNNHEMWCIRVS